MNKKLKSLLFAAVAASVSSSPAAADMPGFWQDTNQPWTAKFFYAPLRTLTPADNWYEVGFDDSEWEEIEGPISTIDAYGVTKWPENYSAYWLRSHFSLTDSEKLIGATLKTFHDDECTVYLNGRKVYEINNVINTPSETYLSSSLFKDGENLIAVYVADSGRGEAYIDFGLLPIWQDEVIVVEVPAPGTLGDLILSKVDNFSDVRAIRISGILNSDDLQTLSQRLTNLRYLDMAKVDMKVVPDYTFRYHARLSKVIFPENLETIGNEAFYNCKALTDVVFPESLRTIGRSAFEYSALNEVILPEGLVSMGDCAFRYCTQNTYVSFPSTLKTIPAQAFFSNYLLSGLSFSEGLESVEADAFNTNNSSKPNQLTEITFPSSLRTISTGVFAYCRKLRDIRFNEGLTRIGDNAFYHCDSLREVTLPSTLVRADASPFDYCDNLRKVTCLSVEPPYMTDQIPYGCGMDGRELFVPAIALNIYKQTTGWDKFPSIKPTDFLPEDIIVTRDTRLTLSNNLPAGYKPNLSLKYEAIDGRWSYGRLEVNGNVNISLNKLSMVMDPYERASYHPFTALVNNVNMRADSIEVTLFPPSLTWTFISLPFDVRVGDIRSCKDGTTSFVIRRYSGENRAAGESGATWLDMHDDDIMKAGEGYILQAVRYVGNNRQNYPGLVLPSIASENLNNVFLSTDASVVLAEYPAEQEHNRGWNLIGNPYPCYYDLRFMSLEAPVTVWDRDYSTYRVYSPLDDSYVFTPGEAFFVQCPAGKPEVAFDIDGRQKTREVRQLSVPSRISEQGMVRKVFNLTLSGHGCEDATRVVFNDEATMGYESNRDAAKFFSHEEAVGQLFTVASDVEYAINERPVADGQVVLGVRIGAVGSYTIALSGDDHGYQVWLDDGATGESVRLDGSTGYAFNADPCKTADRFTLRFVGAGMNTVEGIGSESADGDADGMYTLDGRTVAQPESGTIYIKNGKKVVLK